MAPFHPPDIRSRRECSMEIHFPRLPGDREINFQRVSASLRQGLNFALRSSRDRDREFGKASKPSGLELASSRGALFAGAVCEGMLRSLHAPASCNFDSVW